MEGQQFCLRWHNFQNTLLGTLPKLLNGGYLTDVTLSAGGRHIHAHRIILSACSYYFQELFKDLNTLQHPIIILPGMEYTNLCALVTFMYNGEVNIYQEQLPALLAMADTLHIRGLADIAGKPFRYDNKPTEITSVTEEKESTDLTITKEEPQAVSEPTSGAQENYMDEEEFSSNDLDNVCSVKTKPYYSINAKLNRKPSSSFIKQMDLGRIHFGSERAAPAPAQVEVTRPAEEVEAPALDTSFKFLSNSIAKMSPSSCSNKSNVTCLICGKQLSNQYNLRVHMETHSNSSYSCTACSHVSRSRDALRKHVSYRHPVTASQKRARFTAPKP